MELVATVIDAVSVAVIVGGVVLATTLSLRSGADWDQRFREYRRGVGRSILLGLEFLVAADIVRTVAVSPTFRGVGVLVIIVTRGGASDARTLACPRALAGESSASSALCDVA